MKKKRRFFYFLPLIILAMIAFFSALVQLLWNGVVTDIFQVKTISYWQAAGLFVLCKILFSSFRFGPPGFRRGRHWRNQLMNLSPEERERLRQEWQKRCSGPAKEDPVKE